MGGAFGNAESLMDETSKTEKVAQQAYKAQTNEMFQNVGEVSKIKEQNSNYNAALQKFNEFKETFNELAASGRISPEDKKRMLGNVSEAINLLEKEKDGTITERERVNLLFVEFQFNRELNRVFEENQHKLSENEIKWFEEQIEQSNERIKDLTADVFGIGVRNNFVDYHSQRLMEAIINQVNIANQQKEQTIEEQMEEYVDKISLIRESVRQIAEAKESGEEEKIEEADKKIEEAKKLCLNLNEWLNKADQYCSKNTCTKEENTLINTKKNEFNKNCTELLVTVDKGN